MDRLHRGDALLDPSPEDGVIPFLPTYEAGVDVGFHRLPAGWRLVTRRPKISSTSGSRPRPTGRRRGTLCVVRKARGSVYWSWREEHADSVCILPKDRRYCTSTSRRCYALL